MAKPHYKVTSTDKSGTYTHGYTSSPKAWERESRKEGWKKGQLKYTKHAALMAKVDAPNSKGLDIKR